MVLVIADRIRQRPDRVGRSARAGVFATGMAAMAMCLASPVNAQTSRSKPEVHAPEQFIGGSGARPASRGKRLRRVKSPPPQHSLADRIDRRDASQRTKGVMHFGDTEVRIGGRASFGYGFSGR